MSDASENKTDDKTAEKDSSKAQSQQPRHIVLVPGSQDMEEVLAAQSKMGRKRD